MVFIYNIPFTGPLSGALATGTAIRYGIVFETGSALIGSFIKYWTVQLNKSSSPSGSVGSQIYNSAGTLIDTATETYESSALSTTFGTEYTFTFPTGRTIVAGDKLVITYTGVQRVQVKAHNTDQYDAGLTRRTSWNGSTWSSSSTEDVDAIVSNGVFINQTFTHKYNVRQLATRTFTHIYKIIAGLILISQTFTHIYNLRQLTNQTYTHKYNLRKLVSQAFTHKYNLRQLAAQLFTHKYNIRKLIAASFTHKYNIRQLVNQTFTHKYNLKQLVNRIFTHKYNIIQRVSQTFTHSYNIFEFGVILIARTFTHKYNIIQTVSQTYTHKYNISQSIMQLFTHKYNIKLLVTRSFTHKYNIIQRIAQTYTHKYNIKLLIAQTYIHKYNIIQRVAQTFTHKYNIIKRLVHSFSNISFSSVSFSVDIPTISVSQTFTHQYKIIGRASQTFTHLYNVIGKLVIEISRRQRPETKSASNLIPFHPPNPDTTDYRSYLRENPPMSERNWSPAKTQKRNKVETKNDIDF